MYHTLYLLSNIHAKNYICLNYFEFNKLENI